MSYHSFRYSDEIRLISIAPKNQHEDIHVNVVHRRLSDEPGHEALSYVWGDESDRRSITLKPMQGSVSINLSLTANCWKALKRLQLSDRERLVWVDSICINQNDVEERNAQVRMMGKIYSSAKHVLIHLGEESEDSDLAMQIMAEADFLAFGKTDFQPPEKAALQALFRRAWFTRVWILEEAILAKSALVLCGTKEVPWPRFRQIAEQRNLPDFIPKYQAGTTPVNQHLWPTVLSLSQYTFTGNGGYEAKHLLGQLLHQARICQSGDPRDKVYALLPMFADADEEGLLPDYNLTVEEVYTTVATYMVKKRGLSFLPSVEKPSERFKLPSWVPDWSVASDGKVLGFDYDVNPRYFDASGTYHKPLAKKLHRVVGSSLVVVAKNIGTIVKIGEVLNTSQSGWGTTFQRWAELACQSYETSPDLNRVFELCSALAMTSNFLDTEKDRDSKLHAAGKILSKLCSGADPIYETLEQPNYESQESVQSWFEGMKRLVLVAAQEKILQTSDGRRTIVTDSGHIGLIAADAQVGDVLCIPVDANVCYALRRQQGHFMLVRECYVHGFMNGEAFEHTRESQEAKGESWDPIEDGALEEFEIR